MANYKFERNYMLMVHYLYYAGMVAHLFLEAKHHFNYPYKEENIKKKTSKLKK